MEKENFLHAQQARIDQLEKSISTLDTTISQLTQSQLDLESEKELRRNDNYELNRNNTILHQDLRVKSGEIVQL